MNNSRMHWCLFVKANGKESGDNALINSTDRRERDKDQIHGVLSDSNCGSYLTYSFKVFNDESAWLN